MSHQSSFRRPTGGVPPALVLASMVFLLLGVGPADAKRGKKDKVKPARVEGVVTGLDGTPVTGAVVEISGGEPPIEITATADEKGRFEMELIPPADGKLEIRFTHSDFAPFVADLVLEPGEAQKIEVQLVDAAAEALKQARVAYNDGIRALQAEDTETARNRFSQAAALDPDLAEAHYALADLYLREKWFSEAEQAMLTYRKLRPDDEKGKRLAFDLYRMAGNTEKLKELAESEDAGAEMASALAVTLYNDGVALLNAGDREGAYVRMSEAAAANPGLTQALEALSTLAYDLKKYDETLQWVAKIEEVSPKNARAARMRYLVHDARGQRKEADEALAAYVEIDAKGAVGVLYQRADLDFRQGRTEDAQRAAEKVLSIDPNHARAHYTLGKIAASTNTAAARRHLERFLELAPDDPEAAMAREMLSYF